MSAISVPVKAVFLWAAAQKAKSEGRDSDSQRIGKILSKAVKSTKGLPEKNEGKVANFLSATKSPTQSAVIPLKRDPLDLLLAARVFAEGVEPGFKVYSERSYVETGYLRVRTKDVEYVGSASQLLRSDTALCEFLPDSAKQAIFSILDGFNQNALELVTLSDGNEILALQGELSHHIPIDAKAKYQISLWDGPIRDQAGNLQSKGARNRSLGFASLLANSTGQITIAGLSATTVLEITAASVVGRWLLIEAGDLRIFGQLPDMTVDWDRRFAVMDPGPLLGHYLMNKNPTIYVNPEAISDLANRYRWFVSGDSLIWLEAISK